MATQDVHSVGVPLAGNPKVRNEVWSYIKTDWGTIHARLSGNMVLLERFIRMCMQKFSSAQVERDMEAFFKEKDKTGYDRGLAVVSDTIKGNARYKERDAGVIREWLWAHGYVE